MGRLPVIRVGDVKGCGEDNTTNIYFCMKFKSDQKEDQIIVNLQDSTRKEITLMITIFTVAQRMMAAYTISILCIVQLLFTTIPITNIPTHIHVLMGNYYIIKL